MSNTAHNASPISATAAKALHVDKLKPTTAIDQMRQEAFERTNDISNETHTYNTVYCDLLAEKLGVSKEW